jgi:hypothetical protein
MRCLFHFVKHSIKEKILCLFISAFALSSPGLLSQTLIRPIDQRFRGGEDGFTSFFTKNITVPELELKNGIFGNLIIRILVRPSGELDEISVINPIDSIIDHEVLRVIDLSRGLWRKIESRKEDQPIYIQIGFSRPRYLPTFFIPKSEKFICLFPKPILIPLESDFKVPFLKSQELSAKANLNIENGKFNEALPLINELIHRDPFNRDLYKTRIMINIRLNRQELVEADENKIFNFAEGYSLDELYINQDD